MTHIYEKYCTYPHFPIFLRYNLKGKCAKCDYLYACGGCRAYAYAETGDILAEDSGVLDLM